MKASLILGAMKETLNERIQRKTHRINVLEEKQSNELAQKYIDQVIASNILIPDLTNLIIGYAGFEQNILEQSRRLMRAVVDGNFDQMKQALENGAYVNFKDGYEGKTPLIFVFDRLMGGKGLAAYEFADYLIKNNADVNAQDNKGNSALLNLAKKSRKLFAGCYLCDNRINLMELLIRSGADINHKNNFGETALIISVKAGDDESVEALIKSGANKDITDKSNKNAFYYANFLYIKSNNEDPRGIMRDFLLSIPKDEQDQYSEFVEPVEKYKKNNGFSQN